MLQSATIRVEQKLLQWTQAFRKVTRGQHDRLAYATMAELDLTLNPQATIEVRQIDADNICVIVDDFLVNPESVAEYAALYSDRFEIPPRSYPGMVAEVRANFTGDIQRFVRSSMSKHFGYLRGGIDAYSLLSMTTLKPDELSNLQRLCHSDPRTRPGRANYAGLLYLFRDESLGGTGFYRWKDRPTMEKATALELQDPKAALAFLQEHYPSFREPPCYITESNEIAELIDVVAAKFNRWIFYSGDLPHSAYITAPDKLSDDFRVGRLTLNCFASVVPA